LGESFTYSTQGIWISSGFDETFREFLKKYIIDGRLKMDKSVTLFRATDGTYLDLSRIVAILPVRRIPSGFKVTFGFDIMFLPEGIPFKQDQAFSVTIQKQYDIPLELRGHLLNEPTFGYDEEGQKIFNQFLESSERNTEEHRVQIFDTWKLIRS
jgi:hypothetical protein